MLLSLPVRITLFPGLSWKTLLANTVLTGRRSLAKALPLVRTRKPPNPRPIFSRDLPLELHTLK